MSKVEQTRLNVIIEPIRLEHAEGFRRVYDMVARERKYLAAVEGNPLQRVIDFVANNIARNFPQYVAVSSNHVVGWCDIIPMSLPAHAHAAVLGMGLLPEYRGQGIGLALLEATLRHARLLGLVRVELTVHADNLRAIALYERVGFHIEGTKRDAVFIDGVYKDVVMMASIHRAA
jgi:RimJ/RimL family protein N-acetyltransferase